jgi:hypothetical protein
MPATKHDAENHAQMGEQPSRRGTTLDYRNIISLEYHPTHPKTEKQSSAKIKHRPNITSELILSISEHQL